MSLPFYPEIIVYNCSLSYSGVDIWDFRMDWNAHCLFQIQAYGQIIFMNKKQNYCSWWFHLGLYNNIKLTIYYFLLLCSRLDLIWDHFNPRSTRRMSAFFLRLFVVVRVVWERFQSSQTPELSSLFMLWLQTPYCKLHALKQLRVTGSSDRM